MEGCQKGEGFEKRGNGKCLIGKKIAMRQNEISSFLKKYINNISIFQILKR